MQLKFLDTKVKAETRNPAKALASIFFSIFCIPCYAASVAVGDSLGGGTVFCVSQTLDTSKCVTTGSGEYGLIMANEDQANYDFSSNHGITWSNEDKGTDAQSDDDGAANTATIIAAFSNDNSRNNAAWLCHNYNASGSYTGPGLSDWYLPAKNQLKKMYIYAKANNLIGRDCTGKKDNGVQCLLGGEVEVFITYWSSTQYLSCEGQAWHQRFRYDTQDYGSKGYYFGVRAIRTFNLTIKQFNNLAVRIMTAEAIYEQIAQMPRELIGIITEYATADISKERLEKERGEIAKCILDAAKGWPKVEMEEVARIVKEMEVVEKERQTREARIKAQPQELRRQAEARRAKQAKEEFLAKIRKIEDGIKKEAEAKRETEEKEKKKKEIKLKQDARRKAEEKKSKIEEEKKAVGVRQNVTGHVRDGMNDAHIGAPGTSSILGPSLSFPHS